MKNILVSFLILLSFSICSAQLKIPAGYYLFLIKNCGKETRIVSPLTSVNGIYYLVYGSAEFRKMKSLNFSGMNPVDTNFIVTNFEKIKQRLPKNYFGTLKGYEYSNQQNDDAIWFM